MIKMAIFSLFLALTMGIFFLLFEGYTGYATTTVANDKITETNLSDMVDPKNEIFEPADETPIEIENDDETMVNESENISKEDLETDGPDAEELTWIRSDSLRVGKGPVLKHADGTSAVPFLYFGDYTFASTGMKIKAAFAKDTHNSHAIGRVDSLTAPNSLVITVPRGGDINNGPTEAGNHIYGNTYGDAHSLDGSFGAKGDFVTTDIYDLEVPSDRLNRPSVAGPGVLEKKYSMVEAPMFFYRIDPKTGFEEQRMVFFQQVKRNHTLYEVEVKIVQRFEKNGRVITEINYKNTGSKPISRFMGFAFKDFTLTKDFAEIRDDNGKKAGDFVPIRALGNNRGVYLQSGITVSRYNLFTNLPNGPSSWAGRSISKAHDQHKGYSNGLLGLGGGSRFPWYVGEGDVSHGTYISPDVPKGLKNSFSDMNDLGDAGLNLNAGSRLGGVRENERAWDSGFAMHTKVQTLDVEKSVIMHYASQIDIIGAKFAPAIELDQKGTEVMPDIIQNGAQNYRVTGTWYDFDSTRAELYYNIDTDDTHQGKLIKKLSQSEQSSKNGKPQEWSDSISIADLTDGLHYLRVWVKDSDGNLSEVAQTVINITAPPSIVPTIDILSPESSKTNPFNPTTNNLSLTGTWSDKDSQKIKSVTYKVDDENEEILFQDFENKSPGTIYFWELPALSINKFNDLNLHKVVLTITDYDNNSDSDTFFFQHQEGSYQLIAPHSIDFGTESTSDKSTRKIKPDISGSLQVHDFRSKNQSPLKVILSVDNFTHDLESERTLDHKFYWNNQPIEAKELLIGETQAASSEEWLTTTNLTDTIKNNIQLDFKNNHSTIAGTYTSTWTWKAVESL
ncbi:hypothetical protein [Companilactobacillus keshanensis]|uniref:WxL domain-containing protein n=1 Tax=Companilactobacillus keshanensis TaxID=2486003 RepID=A0ABW4BU45_9LACO|nr:hypothetical protein [Companilactobacillus keshanensis]